MHIMCIYIYIYVIQNVSLRIEKCITIIVRPLGKVVWTRLDYSSEIITCSHIL